MDSVIIILTSSYNDSCNCHPEYEHQTIGAFSTQAKADEYIENAPKTIESRGITRTLSYDTREVFLLS